MSNFEVGTGLAALCSEGKYMEAIDRYYSDNVESVEGHPSPGIETQVKGIEAVRQKNRSWMEDSEVHSIQVDGPFVSEGSNQFALHFRIDVTDKKNGKRVQGSEIGLYTVKDGKIVREEFFYPAE